MLISAPFLSNGTTEDNTDRIQFAYTGQYPVTSRLEWHNGQHLVAPQDANGYAEVRAIADGKVIYVDQPNAAPSADKTHPQNYATFGSSPEWTDKGMVIIEHTTEIGATGNTPTTITFYSVYAHLKEIAAGVATGKAIYRKDIIGKPGQIYGEAGHLHFEICLDDANIKLLLGKDPSNWPAAVEALECKPPVLANLVLDHASCEQAVGLTKFVFKSYTSSSPYATDFDLRHVVIVKSNRFVLVQEAAGIKGLGTAMLVPETRLITPPAETQIVNRKVMKRTTKRGSGSFLRRECSMVRRWLQVLYWIALPLSASSRRNIQLLLSVIHLRKRLGSGRCLNQRCKSAFAAFCYGAGPEWTD